MNKHGILDLHIASRAHPDCSCKDAVDIKASATPSSATQLPQSAFCLQLLPSISPKMMIPVSTDSSRLEDPNIWPTAFDTTGVPTKKRK
mmetsp:Transcript_36576/g.81662  ORF Transcript_36576/g.81662 Transcript_36576/m.81662 type:complete len:89 (-) Transcript_36576:132-398(-)